MSQVEHVRFSWQKSEARLWGATFWIPNIPRLRVLQTVKSERCIIWKVFSWAKKPSGYGSLTPICWDSGRGVEKKGRKMLFLENLNSWSSASSGTNIATSGRFPNINQVILLLIGTDFLVPLCAHHSSSNILTRCQLAGATASVTSWLEASSPVLSFPSAWEERVHLAALHSSSTEPAGPRRGCLSRAAHLVSIWRSTARTRRAMGKGWPSWSQSSAAGRQDHSGRSVCRQTVIPLFVQLRKSWTIVLEITSLILQVCCTDYAAR